MIPFGTLEHEDGVLRKRKPSFEMVDHPKAEPLLWAITGVQRTLTQNIRFMAKHRNAGHMLSANSN